MWKTVDRQIILSAVFIFIEERALCLIFSRILK